MSSAAAIRSQLASVMIPGSVWIVDLDGVIWLSGEPIGDVCGAVARLTDAGITLGFATNNSGPTTRQLLDRLTRIGIEAAAEDLVSSAGAAASLLQPGQSAYVLAESGVHESMKARGIQVCSAGPVDVAVVGLTQSFDYEALNQAARAARESGRLIGTNGDPTHPTPDGLIPGTGALLAAVAAASGVTPEIAGKPHRPMADLIRTRFGLGPNGPPAMVVGDQPGTDGRLAAQLGVPFALVDSGVTRADEVVDDVEVAVRTRDFVELVDNAIAAS